MIYFLFFNIFLTLFACISANDCCPLGQVLLKRKNVCWDPKSNVIGSNLMKCNDTFRFTNDFSILQDGRLSMKIAENFYETYDQDQFCASFTTKKTDVELKNLSLVVLMCIDEEEMFDDRVLGYCMIVSIIFLVPTALIYAALSELRDVQGKSIINFCLSLSIGQGILAIMKLMEYSDMNLCAVRGFLTYFFIIASFFWTNSISIQVLLNTRRPATLDYSWKEFKWYFIYSWGCPTILTTCMAIVNFHPGTHAKPGIGLNHCWFLKSEQQWYYMFSVMTLLLAINIGIFIYTSLVLWRQHFTSSHLQALRYKLLMTGRLILLMGLPWVFEMIGSLAGQHVIWFIIDIFNSLQGLLIFLLLVVSRRRVIKVMYKHGWLDCISAHVERYLAVEEDVENVVQHTDVPMATWEKPIN